MPIDLLLAPQCIDMAEERVFFESGNLQIEGFLGKTPGDRGVVVTHPHPLYGGSMHSNVVKSIVQTYGENGYTTLRFNFRGVGKSEGVYEEGVGEQDEVKAALKYLFQLGKERIDLAGYSFGAWVNAFGIGRFEEARRLILVAPPVNFMSFDFLKDHPKIQLVIVGTEDDIADLTLIEELVPKWHPEAVLKKINGADHFFSGHTVQLMKVIHEFLDDE